MTLRISWIALSSALCLSTPLLHAEPKAAPGAAPPKSEADAIKAQAAQRFDRGLQLFNEGDNAGALAEFKQTYALLPNPIVLYNIGLVYAAMGRSVDAVDALTPVVDSATLSPAQREQAQKSLDDQRQRIGRVSVSSVPEGARIDVDGVEVARTPLTAPLRVTEGSHVIGAVAEGYAHARKEIIVAGNADAAVTFELVLGSAKRPANLTIRSRTADADIVVDDKAIGKTPLSTSVSVPAGKHSVELRRPGYHSSRQDVEVGEGATGEVSLDLDVDDKALLRDGADLSIEAREPNVDLTIDDEHRGVYRQALRLPKGVHHLRMQVAGYLPLEQDVVLYSGKPTVLMPYFQPTPETRQAHDSNVRWHRTLGWIGIGTGAAITGVGVALAAIGGSEKSKATQEFDDAEQDVEKKTGICDSTMDIDLRPCDERVLDAQSRVDKARTKQTIGFVGIGAGVAVLATGVVILLTGESSHRFDPPQSAPRPRRLAVTPGPGQFGLGLLGTF